MQVNPSIQLSGLIRHYLFLNKDSRDTLRLRLFSDGTPGLVFHSGPHLAQNAHLLPNAFIYGQITDYKDLFCCGQIELFIVVFHPDALHRLLGLPAAELKDKVIPLADLFGARAGQLSDAIANSSTLSEKIQQTEHFFHHELTRLSTLPDPLITATLDLIGRQQGQLSVSQLVTFTGLHPRQLERKFTTAIGLSPKKFCTIIRIHHFLRQLQITDRSLTQCAYASGYYDQAHLIREFRNFTGLTPSQYRKQTAPLAVNFLQL